MFKPTRQVLSGISHQQISSIISDKTVEPIIPYPIFPCFQIQNLFYTEENPQSLATRDFNKPYTIDLPAGAMRFMIVRMPTKQEMIECLQKAGQPLPEDWTKYNLHNTDSVDYIYVISGQITCVVGNELLQLRQGDFLAQIGAEHTWINDHDTPCYIFCVMVGIHPTEQRKKMSVE